MLGLALLNVSKPATLVQSVIYGLGAVGLFLAVHQPAERLAAADVPLPFRGIAIAMIAGLMSLAFMGFSGLIKS